MTISGIDVRNPFKSRINAMITKPMISEVYVATPVGIGTSVITTRAVHQLGFGAVKQVIALAKAWGSAAAEGAIDPSRLKSWNGRR